MIVSPSSQAQPLSSLHISNFLEPHLYHIDSLPPTTSSPHIPQSSSSSGDICFDPVDESLQVNTSLACFSLPPSTSDPTSIKLTVDSFSSLGSHPMITRAKAGILKTRHLANLGILSSYELLYALLASTELIQFKYAAKNPVWVAAMDEEI